MTITPTSGYVMNTEMRAHYEVLPDENYWFMPFSMVNRPQPNGNRDDDQYGYLQDMKLRLNDVGGSTVLNRYNSLNFNGASVLIDYNTASPATLWTAHEELSAKTNGIRKTTSQSGIDLRIEKGIFTSRVTGTTASLGTTSIDAILMERNPDNGNLDNVEVTGNRKSIPSAYEWSPFGENESASAYVFKEIVVNNGLVVNGKTSESRTYPIIRATGA